ncbi:MAG TPA: ABC transporter substrate-binding protein [Planctomycetota bacterium]|jgi:oligopeptide transport system substrate-binding protein
MSSRSSLPLVLVLAAAACGKPASPAAQGAPESPARPQASAADEARRLLAEAGYPDGKGFPEFEIIYNKAEWHTKIAAAIQEMWRSKLGIKVVTRNTEWKVYLDLVQKGRFDIARRGYFGEYIDPEAFLSLFTADSGYNSGGWTSAGYDRMIFQSDRELDPAKRYALLGKAERLLLDEAPLMPLYNYIAHNLMKPFIKGVYHNVREMHPLQNVTLEGEGAPADGTLIFNISEEPHSLDPALADDIAGLKVLMHVFEGLANYDPRDASPVPAAAERWEISPDGLRWTFHLRPARWSNGDPVTAEDFAWSWRRAMSPKMPSAYKERMYVVKNARAISRGEASLDALGVRAVDDRTLVVDLEHPAPYFAQLVCLMVYYPVHRATVERHGDKWIEPDRIVHNGPYRIVEARRGDRMIFEANPRYRAADALKLKRFIFLHVTDERTALSLYETGQCHWLFRIPTDLVDQMRGRPDYMAGPIHGTYFYTFNLKKKPLDDVRVRRALSLAVDRETIVKRILRGGEEASDRLTPPLYPGYEVK